MLLIKTQHFIFTKYDIEIWKKHPTLHITFQLFLEHNKSARTTVSILKGGLKDFAYEMEGFKKGYYVILEIEADPDKSKALKEFQRLASLNANVIRYLITKANA